MQTISTQVQNGCASSTKAQTSIQNIYKQVELIDGMADAIATTNAKENESLTIIASAVQAIHGINASTSATATQSDLESKRLDHCLDQMRSLVHDLEKMAK